MVHLGELGQTELPDRSVLIGQKFQIKKLKWDIFDNFETLWCG